MTWQLDRQWLALAFVGAAACGDDAVGTSGTEGTESGSSSTGAGPSSGMTADDGGPTGPTSDGSGESGTTAVLDTTAGSDTAGSESTGEPGTSSGSGGDTSSGSAGSESGSSGSDGMMASGCYEPAVHPFAGALCDPAAAGCTVAADEAVDPVAAFRNGTPAITHDDGCAPQILYSTASNGFQGWLAARQGADDWDTVATPDPVALGGIEYDATQGHTQVLMYDGAFGVHYSTFSDGAFTDEPDPAVQAILRASGSASLGDGVLQLGLYSSSNAVVWGEYDGGWSVTTGDPGEYPAAAVTDTGAPQITYWGTPLGSWAMYWLDPVADTTELIELGGTNVLQQSEQRIAIVGDTPHVVYARQSLGLHEIRHAERTGVDTWAIETVAAEDPLVNETCEFAVPSANGQTCDYDYIRLRPLGLAASQGGDVLVLYAEDHFIGTLVASCMAGPPFPTCMWIPQSDSSEFTTWIAAPDGSGGWDAQVVVDDRRIVGTDTSLDSDGALHIAAYVEAEDGSVVDYLRVE